MGIPTLILAQTASGDSSLDFIDGTDGVVFDSTYDEYMFVFTDIGPATDAAYFSFQVNATDDAGGGYDTSPITSTSFVAHHYEDDSTAGLNYSTGRDQGNAAGFQAMIEQVGNGADESCAGILHLFSPSSTTYVKHFYSRFSEMHSASIEQDCFAAGYINDTTAIDEIRFKMSSGNFDGVIQMYGIS